VIDDFDSDGFEICVADADEPKPHIPSAFHYPKQKIDSELHAQN